MSAMGEGVGRGARAGFWRRFAAALVDGVLLGIVSAILVGVTSATTGRAVGGLVGLVYFVFLEGSASGQTIGKKALGIRVYDFRGGTANGIGYGRAIIRYFGRIVSAIPILLGYFWMIWDKEKQTWHDKFAGSVVVPMDQYPSRAGRAKPLRDVGPVAVERRVEAAGAEQLVVGALLDDAPVLEDDDHVGVADRRQAVGDHEGGAAVEQPPERPLDRAFGADVDASSSPRRGSGCAGRRGAARANATSWRCPSESREPRSPSGVS